MVNKSICVLMLSISFSFLTPKELIIGTWRLDYIESKKDELSLEFKRNNNFCAHTLVSGVLFDTMNIEMCGKYYMKGSDSLLLKYDTGEIEGYKIVSLTNKELKLKFKKEILRFFRK